MWQAATRRAPLCAALPLRGPPHLRHAPDQGRAARSGAATRTMYAATMPPPGGVCTDPV